MYEFFYVFSLFVMVWNVYVVFGLIINIMLMEFLWFWVYFYFFYIKFVIFVSIFGNFVILRCISIKKNLFNGIRFFVVMYFN